MEFEIIEDLTPLDADALARQEAGALEAFAALQALGDDITDEQIDQMEALAAHVAAIRAEGASRAEAAAARQSRIDAAAAAVAVEEPEAEVEEEEVETEEVETEEVEEPEAVAAAAAPRKAASLVRRTPKKEPVRPAETTNRAVLTAAADIPGVPAGSNYGDLTDVAKAFIARSKAFPQTKPGQEPKTRTRHQYGIATFSRGDFGGLTDENPDHADGMALLTAAANEHRLPGGNLLASGGWCAPSETIYDLCDGRESLDGLWDVPEIGVTRGGIRFTTGPDFRSMLSGSGLGFWQTEAQAIAGVSKDCFEITCPEFEEVRLDAVGICIKAPILTNAAYPELVRRWIEGSLVAHQHRVSAALLAQMVTALGPATVGAGTWGAVAETLTALELVAESLREAERMAFGTTLEVVVPFWLRAAFRGDLANRNGVDATNVTNAEIDAHFANRGLRVQYVYNWQYLGAPPVLDFPDTVTVAMYPAGTFVKGTADVISLDTVYDSTDLTSNIYTATFVEEGVLLAQMCGNGALVELPVCVSGQTGAADLSVCYGVTDTSS